MNGTNASVVFILSHYRLHGNVSTGSARILDLFNDQTRRLLKIENARFFRPLAEEPVTDIPTTVLVKENVVAALLMDEDRPNDTKFFFAAQQRKNFNALISMPTVMIEGRVHAKTANDPESFLSLEAATFFPVTRARVFDYAVPGKQLESQVVLINKDAITSISFDVPGKD